MGLPGAGKTTLSLELAKVLNAVHFNADEIRKEVNKDLGFNPQDRIEHARRMGKLCDIVVRAGQYVIADFVCPTEETREAFGLKNTFVIFVNRTTNRNYIDTTKMFIEPNKSHVIINNEGSPFDWAIKIKQLIISNI